MTGRARRSELAALGVLAVGMLGETLAAQPTLAPGGFVVIAENVVHDGSWRAFYVPEGGGPAQVLGTLTFGPNADLPPAIRSSWFNDRLEVVVSDGAQMVTFQPFGGGGSETLGTWGGGATFVGVSAFDDSLLAFEVPVFGFEVPVFGIADPIIARRVALWETSWVTFENPKTGFDDPLLMPVSFDDPLLQVLPDRLQAVDGRDDTAAPMVVPGTQGLGVIVAATAFPPGSVASDPQPDIPGQPAIGLIAGDGNGLYTLYGIWGTDGTSFDGVDGEAFGGVQGEAIWGTGGTTYPITQGGLMVNPIALMAYPGNEWLGSPFSLLVLDNGFGMRTTPRIIGVRPNGDQDLVTQGGLLVSPADFAVDGSGLVIVADPEASGGDGAIIGVDPLTGVQSVLVQGGIDVGLRRPIAVGVVRCAPPTFQVTTTSDFVDPNPGDGDPSDGFGNVCLRSAIMEANASPCAAGMIIELGAGTWPLSLPGGFEDACLTGDLDVTGYVRICGRGPGVTVIDGEELDRVFDVRAGGTLALANLTVTGGHPPGISGGGVAETGGIIIATNVEIAQCFAGGGGGGISASGGDAIVIGSTISGNASNGNGGGLSANNGAGVIVAQSLVAYNEVILNGAGLTAAGAGTSMNIVNTTLSANRASLRGGGLFCNNAAVTVNHATIVNNVADAGEASGYTGGGLAQAGGSLTLGNSIVAQNRAGATLPQNGLGTIDTPGYVLFDDLEGFTLTGNTASVLRDEPMINALADNGGPTMTHAISSQSPAVDASDPMDPMGNDQRYTGRPSDGDADSVARSDMGAYEYVPPVCPGDVDGDGDTDVFDFGVLAANFGTGVPFNTSGDLDGDGDVDVFDFGLLAAGFGCTSM